MPSNANIRFIRVSAAGIVQRHHMNKIDFIRYRTKHSKTIQDRWNCLILYWLKPQFNISMICSKTGSITCVASSCLDQSCAATAHRQHKASDIKHVDVCLFLLQGLPQLNFVGRGVWSSFERSFPLSPQVLNRIHIWRVGWPLLKNTNIVCSQKVSCCKRAMCWGVVLLEHHLAIVPINKF